jgi:hypothetical protein
MTDCLQVVGFWVVVRYAEFSHDNGTGQMIVQLAGVSVQLSDLPTYTLM